MSDPVAQAAAQIAADAAPSSTEPSVLGEIIGEFKALGEKVEHLIHPEHGQEAGGAAAGESNGSVKSNSSSNVLPTTGATSPSVNEVSASSNVSSGSSQPPSTSTASTSESPSQESGLAEVPNAAATPAANTAAAEGTGEAGNVVVTAGTSAPVVTGSADVGASSNSAAPAPAAGEIGHTAEDPNAAATPPFGAATPAGVGSAIRSRLQAIKGHLAGFEQSSVMKIIAELEGIERLI